MTLTQHKYAAFGILSWQRRDTDTTDRLLAVVSTPITTPKEQILLEALTAYLGFNVKQVACLAPTTPIPPHSSAVLVLGEHTHPLTPPCCLLPTLAHLLSHPLDKRQAWHTLRAYHQTLSIP